MIYLEEQNENTGDLWDGLYALILRAIAGVMIAVTLYYWLRLIGFYEGEEFKFNTMSAHWKVACLTMAVFSPVAAIGLWLLTSWGVVIALMIAFVNLIMFIFLSSLFGFHFIFFVTFLTCFILLAIFQGLFWWRHH